MGKKKMGLLQQDGMAIVTFNLGYNFRMRTREKWRICSHFARQAARQSRRLPRPDLLLVSLPPLTVTKPALLISTFYRVPLIIEIREIDNAIITPVDNWWKRILASPVQRTALITFHRATSIIATSQENAVAIAQITLPGKAITVIPDHLAPGSAFDEFSKILTTIEREQKVIK